MNNSDSEKIRIYKDLFGEVKNRLSEENRSKICSEEAFLSTVKNSTRKIRYENLDKLEGEDFLFAVFLSVFQRLPDDNEIKFYSTLSKEEILKKIANSGAYSIRKIEFEGCPYSVKPGFKGSIIGMASAVSSSTFLRSIAKKMPGKLQNRIRRLFA